MAVSKYDKENLTQSQQDKITNVTSKAEAGEMSWEDAHAQAESIRNGYGYSGGGDGSEYNQIISGVKKPSYEKPPAYEYEPFSYESAPSYANKYQGQIDALTKDILGREAFSYDPEKDDTYKQYQESYTRNGQRAMQDTLGQVSARTGGLASSYAGNASQQTYDNYMGALADKIPELKQLAYSMYRDEGSDQRANLDMLQALESGDYNKYMGLLGQYNSDRSFNYGVYSDDRNFGYQMQRDGVSDGRYENEWDYNVGRDEISDKRYEDETAYNHGNYKSETEYNIALQKAQTLAAGGDFSGYLAMGYTAAEIGNLKSAYNKAQAGGGKGGSSGGGSSGNSGGTSGDIYEWLSSSGAKDYGTAYQLLRNAGYSTTDAGRYAKYFEDGWSGSNDDKIAQAAADYYQQNPGIALDSRTLDYWLNDNGYSRETAQLFKAYLEAYGAKYSRG